MVPPDLLPRIRFPTLRGVTPVTVPIVFDPKLIPVELRCPTLDEFVNMDPRVGDLVADARATRTVGRATPGWCPAQCFNGTFKGRIVDLVGPDRKPADTGLKPGSTKTEMLLRKSNAYDVVHSAVSDALTGVDELKALIASL
jgi:hypothetical protein